MIQQSVNPLIKFMFVGCMDKKQIKTVKILDSCCVSGKIDECAKFARNESLFKKEAARFSFGVQNCFNWKFVDFTIDKDYFNAVLDAMCEK